MVTGIRFLPLAASIVGFGVTLLITGAVVSTTFTVRVTGKGIAAGSLTLWQERKCFSAAIFNAAGAHNRAKWFAGAAVTAVAPGSEKLLLISTLIEFALLSVITCPVVSTTVTVRVLVATLGTVGGAVGDVVSARRVWIDIP